MADSPMQVVQSFVAAINAGDLKALRSLMTDDHVFTDAQGRQVSGAEKMIAGWRFFFDTYPQYWVMVDHAFEDGHRVALIGQAGGRWQVAGKVLPETWQVGAAWLAEVQGTQVRRWSVFCDTSWTYPPLQPASPEEPSAGAS